MRNSHWLLVLASPLALVLLGCGSANRDPVRPASATRATADIAGPVPDCVPPDTIPDPNAPHVEITNPRSVLLVSFVPPDFTVNWQGSDADGRVREYRFRLFSESNPDFPDIYDFVEAVRARPWILETLYGPCFDTWERALPHVTSHTFHGLQPDERYLFAITAVDDDGKHDSNFSNRTNVWAAYVAYPGSVGPRIHFASGSWTFSYVNGGYLNDPSRYADLTVTAGQPVTISWGAQPIPVTELAGFRFGLDLTDLDREGPQGAGTPSGRWSSRSLDHTSATVGPFGAGETHLFYVDVLDSNGLASLGIVRLIVVAAARDLAGR